MAKAMSGAKERKADVLEYCDSVYSDLSEVKRKIFNIVCQVEASTAEEEKRRAEYFDLFEIVDAIEKKLESLTKDCPSNWKVMKKQIESNKVELDQAVNWWFG